MLVFDKSFMLNFKFFLSCLQVFRLPLKKTKNPVFNQVGYG